MSDFSRRDFIRLTGGLLGGVLLTGCRGSGGSSPNGYAFYRLVSTGDMVGDGARAMSIAEFGGSVHIGSGGVVTFDAYDVNKRHGLFQLDVDFTRSLPLVGRQTTSVISGDVLADLRTVRDFVAHDVDGEGNIAAILKPKASGKQGHYFGGLYYKPRNAGFAAVLIHGDPLDGGDTTASGHFGDVALSDHDGIVVVASHLPKAPGAASGRGLMHFAEPAAGAAAANRLLGAEDFLAGTDHQIKGFGIVDVGVNGHFAVSAHAAPSDLLGATNAPADHFMLTGHLSAPNDLTLLAAPPLATASLHTGAISYGPRVAGDGTVFTKLGGYQGNNVEALVKGANVIRRTDQPGPSGEYAASFTPGATAADGSYYYTQYVENADGTVSIDLLMYDGSAHHPLLAAGDRIVNVADPVVNIVFSTTTNHVDGDNRIVMLCQFDDATTGLVVGIPV